MGNVYYSQIKSSLNGLSAILSPYNVIYVLYRPIYHNFAFNFGTGNWKLQ